MSLSTGLVILNLGTQAIVIGDPLSEGSRSAFVSLNSRIPTRLCSGCNPVYHLLALIGNICRKNQIEFHPYADDTQMYLSFKPSIPNSKSNCTVRIEKCIDEIKIWMTENLLKLNSDKTEVHLVWY